MATRYVIRKDASGFTVADNFTGEPLVLAMDPQTGLSEEVARHLADLFNKRAEQGERAIQQ
jgi:phage terminase large subunit-like protein